MAEVAQDTKIKSNPMNIDVILFEMMLNHNLSFTVNNGNINFPVDQQKITISEFAIYPDLDIKTLEAMAEYKEGNENAIRAAVEAVKSNLVTYKNPEDILSAASAAETKKPEVNEAKIEQMGDTEFSVITNRLKISKQIKLEKEQKSFIVSFNSREISGFINYVESKKIKIFINSEEVKPKFEVDFLKRVFPYVEVKITLK